MIWDNKGAAMQGKAHQVDRLGRGIDQNLETSLLTRWT